MSKYRDRAGMFSTAIVTVIVSLMSMSAYATGTPSVGQLIIIFVGWPLALFNAIAAVVLGFKKRSVVGTIAHLVVVALVLSYFWFDSLFRTPMNVSSHAVTWLFVLIPCAHLAYLVISIRKRKNGAPICKSNNPLSFPHSSNSDKN